MLLACAGLHRGEASALKVGRLDLAARCAPDALLFAGPQGGTLRASNFRRRVFGPAVTRAGLARPRQRRGRERRPDDARAYRLDKVSKTMHKRRARVLAKAKAKKATWKAREAAAELKVMELTAAARRVLNAYRTPAAPRPDSGKGAADLRSNLWSLGDSNS